MGFSPNTETKIQKKSLDLSTIDLVESMGYNHDSNHS